jgi:hypothetical protein
VRAAPYRLLFVLAASLTFMISWSALAQETPTPTPTSTDAINGVPRATPTETATLLPPLQPTESPVPSPQTPLPNDEYIWERDFRTPLSQPYSAFGRGAGGEGSYIPT